LAARQLTGYYTYNTLPAGDGAAARFGRLAIYLLKYDFITCHGENERRKRRRPSVKARNAPGTAVPADDCLLSNIK